MALTNETLTSLLSDVSNFNLGIFGISITVFTVLYAFILTRKDGLREFNEQVKNGQGSPRVLQKIYFFKEHIRRWRKLNNHLKNIVSGSIFFFLVGMLVKYIPVDEYREYIALTLVVLTVMLTFYILIILTLVFKNYNKSTSIS